MELLKNFGKSGFRIPHTGIRKRQIDDDTNTELVINARNCLFNLNNNINTNNNKI